MTIIATCIVIKTVRKIVPWIVVAFCLELTYDALKEHFRYFKIAIESRDICMCENTRVRIAIGGCWRLTSRLDSKCSPHPLQHCTWIA